MIRRSPCPALRVLLIAPGIAASALVAIADAPTAQSRHGVVASDSPEASRIGAAILEAGGNAFDAAVAVSLALSVARPESTGLGGGGFLLAYLARERRFVALDFRETAPAEATPERYARANAARGDDPPVTLYGGNAIATPGLVPGLAEITRRFGTRSFDQLARPATELAQRGFEIDDNFRRECEATLRIFERHAHFRQRFGPLYRTFLGNGAPPAIGARLQRPELARALRILAEEGPTAFTEGQIASAIAGAASAAGGALRLSDLKAYRVVERTPLRTQFRAFEIVGMPPPSSGGVCIAQVLNVLDAQTLPADALRLAGSGARPITFDHAMLEAIKHAFADRSRHMGDPDFARVPTAQLIDRAYTLRLAARIRADGVAAHADYGSADPAASEDAPDAGPPPALPDDRGTSHFCVADRHGNVVSMTETINGAFGSFVVVEPFGFILNNEMDDFTAEPGEPNLFGLVQSETNAIAPGKRPLSSMSPTIVLRDAKPMLAVGGSGGPRIITSVLNVLVNALVFEMPLESAVAAPRIHHQWRPDAVFFDIPATSDRIEALRERGHTVSEQRRSAAVQAIEIRPDGMQRGVSDPRKGGVPAAAQHERSPDDNAR